MAKRATESEEELEEGPISKKVKLATVEGHFQGDIPAPHLSPGNLLVVTRPIQLSFNIPENHKGPFQVFINLSSLNDIASSVTGQGYTPANLSHGIYESVAKTDTPSTELEDITTKVGFTTLPAELVTTSTEVEEVTTKIGFTTLPAELRNRIYRTVFKGDLVCLGRRCNMSRSAAFLATCKQILQEGRTILYGENVFHFRRDPKYRGNFYDEHWNEIGYKDVRQFLEMIGPVNISLLRDIGISFTDALPSQAPDTPPFLRKYINDMNLRNSIQLLVKHSQLDHIKLEVSGRCRLRFQDKWFLDALKKLKASHVCVGYLHETDEYSRSQAAHRHRYGHGDNLDDKVRADLERVMVRQAVNT